MRQAPSSRGSAFVKTVHTLFKHNLGESLMNDRDIFRLTEAALQAASRPIFNRRFFQGGLTDCLTPPLTGQIWLSGASRGIDCLFLSVLTRSIHNCRLWIEKGFKTGKMDTSIFLVFNLKKTSPRLEQDVNRGFLALALRKSGIDILGKLWHSLDWSSPLCGCVCNALRLDSGCFWER